MAFLGPLLGALGGGIAGAFNPRPPSLDLTQSHVLDGLLSQLYGKVQGTPTIDPVQQANMFGQIAQSTTGANNQATHALTSRGLGTSGLLGSALMQNASTAASSQNTANLSLQQQAVQLQQQGIQQILGLLGISNIPGQSALGGAFNGIAPMLGFMGAMNGGGGGGASPGSQSGAWWNGGNPIS